MKMITGGWVVMKIVIVIVKKKLVHTKVWIHKASATNFPTPVAQRGRLGPCQWATGAEAPGTAVTDGPERLFWPNKSYPPPARGV